MTTTEKKDSKDEKVISLAAIREAKKDEPPLSEAQTESYFETLEKMNKEKQERMKKERAQNNKNTLRSYRIKD